MASRAASEASRYEEMIWEISRMRDFRARCRNIVRLPVREVERQLREINLNTQGSDRAKAERLFRARIRMIGTTEVPCYPETDEAEGVVLPEEEELVMAQSDQGEYDTEEEWMSEQPHHPWPSNKGLPSIP